MGLKRWFLLLGLVLGCGMLQVTWRHALIMKGYQLGERLERVQAAQTEVRQLTSQVVGLESPVHLARASQERKLGLVAWSVLPMESQPAARLIQVAAGDGAGRD